MKSPLITGSFFTRGTSKRENCAINEEIIVLMGVFKVPRNLLQQEVVYSSYGQVHPDLGVIQFDLLINTFNPVPDVQGHRIDQILTSPIWRV